MTDDGPSELLPSLPKKEVIETKTKEITWGDRVDDVT